MRTRNLSLLASLLIIGILSASGSTYAAGINNAISGATNISIGRIADQYAIARSINGITIEKLIAITSIHDAKIHDEEIDLQIIDITA
jgi:hypothetical protein